jgi:lambda family phage portal protein
VTDFGLQSVRPVSALQVTRARALELQKRKYEAAKIGGRGTNWVTVSTDANQEIGPGINTIRTRARTLVENNGWAQQALAVLQADIIGDGVKSTIAGAGATPEFLAAWKDWAGTTACDAAGRQTLDGILSLCARSIAESGEVLIRRRPRRPSDGLPIPLALQVLEADFLDTNMNGIISTFGGPTIYGIEYDAIGRRRGYWLFDQHPGSGTISAGMSYQSHHVDASEILHVFRVDRPGQDRGVSWFASAIPTLLELDEYEDASLVKQKVAAMLAAFVTDDGMGQSLGAPVEDDPLLTEMSPGMVYSLPQGKTVSVVNPPSVVDGGFDVRQLRKIAAAIGVPYEAMTGDYSQFNFSSGRMSRLRYFGRIRQYRYHVFTAQLLDPLWAWITGAAITAGLTPQAPRAAWTFPPPDMLEPDKEAIANRNQVRAGMKTQSEVVREQGYDPEEFFAEMSADNKRLDALGIVLDSDPRKVSQMGQAQSTGGSGGATAGSDAAAPVADAPGA